MREINALLIHRSQACRCRGSLSVHLRATGWTIGSVDERTRTMNWLTCWHRVSISSTSILRNELIRRRVCRRRVVKKSRINDVKRIHAASHGDVSCPSLIYFFRLRRARDVTAPLSSFGTSPRVFRAPSESQLLL